MIDPRRPMAAVALLLASAAAALTAGSVQAATIHAPPSVETAKAEALKWIAARGIKDAAVLKHIGGLWADASDVPARELLERVVATFAAGDAQVQKLVELSTLVNPPLTAPQPAALRGNNHSEFYLSNLRLYFGSYLTQRQMYDEALTVLSKARPGRVVDPASLFFYKAVCEHQLLQKAEGLKTLKDLLENTEDVPVSYSSVATLMQHELQSFKPRTLNSVARKMNDSHRRLDLARGGQRVQKVQKEIIAELDELIKKLEAQGGG